MTTATQQHQMLSSIWPRWLEVATSTGNTDRKKAEQAVARLYEFYGQHTPRVYWTSLRSLPAFPASLAPPLICHFRDALIHSVWHMLAEPSWVCTQIGYERRTDRFLASLNIRRVLSRTRVQEMRRRPPWLTNAINVISQFDVDALAIHELASHITDVSADLKMLAKIGTDLVTSCFAAILFEENCLLVPKPTSVLLNAGVQLHAQRQPAFVMDNLTIYAMNGEVLSVNREPPMARNLDLWVSPRRRVLFIEYLGWEEYFREVERRAGPPQVFRIDKSKYGTLYRLIFHNQEMLVVRVKNRTREPDGSYQHYVIPVDPECRPLPDPNRPEQPFGPPQELTALNAVASTFYMTGADYAATLGAES